MTDFTENFLDMEESVGKDVNLVKALIELIQRDASIGDGEEFFIGEYGEKTKRPRLAVLKEYAFRHSCSESGIMWLYTGRTIL